MLKIQHLIIYKSKNNIYRQRFIIIQRSTLLLTNFVHFYFRTNIEQAVMQKKDLIEPKQVSQQILIKIITEITTKYELTQKIYLPQFIKDTNNIIQELMLYNNTISQFFRQGDLISIQRLSVYHREMFRFVQFLFYIIQKIKNKAKNQNNNLNFPSTICSNCQNYIHQRNIKNMQREILDYQRYSLQRFDQQLRIQFQQNREDSNQDEKFIISEEFFRRKICGIQKSMNQRQISLMECIDDFEFLRTTLLIEIKKRENKEDISMFNIREYITDISEQLLLNFRKIQERLLHFRNVHGSLQDKFTQTLEESQKAPNTQRNQINKQNLKLQAELKKSNQAKEKCQNICKKYQAELRDCSAKIQALESYNKKLREEIFEQKMIGTHKQKLLKSVEKIQQKISKHKSEQQKRPKESAITSFQNLLSEAGQFANEFQQCVKQCIINKDLSNNQEEVACLIKKAFKKTLDRFIAERSQIIEEPEKKKAIKTELQAEYPKESRRTKEKNIRVPFQRQENHKNSRFQIRNIKNNFVIQNVINYRILGSGKSQNQINSLSQKTNRSIHHQQFQNSASIQKRKRLAKLSIFSNSKQEKEQLAKRNPFQKRRQSTEANSEQLSNHFLSTNILNGQPIKKSNFKRNKSQQELKSVTKIQDSFKITKLKPQIFDCIAVKKFFFTIIPSQNVQPFIIRKDEKESPQIISVYRSKFMSDGLEGDQKIKKQKNILNLEELNYLTALSSYLAKVHLVDPDQYAHLKNYIQSTSKRPKVKQDESSQSLAIRKMLSQIIYRHRQCHSSSSLCHHLYDFIRSIESILQAEGESVRKQD